MRPQIHRTDLSWGWPTGGSQSQVSYAYDWALPDNNATRVVMADRSPRNHGGKGVMAAFGDAHTKFLKTDVALSLSDARTIDADSVVPNPDAIGGDNGTSPGLPDNIFDSAGDNAGPADPSYGLKPLNASPRRAWVK